MLTVSATGLFPADAACEVEWEYAFQARSLGARGNLGLAQREQFYANLMT
jgi:hypothetical protein